MGIFTSLATSIARAEHRALEVPARSPFNESKLARVVLSELAGVKPTAITRAEAMSVPSIVKARSLIIGALARQPLTQWQNESKLSTPAWLARTDSEQTPQHRLAWTLDDLIFYGRSLWYVDRDTDRAITDAIRLPMQWWQLDELGRVCIRYEESGPAELIDAKKVILFENFQEGLLDIAADTVRGARDIEKAWRDRVSSPVPLVELHETDQMAGATNTEAEELVATWEAARRRSGTAFTPFGIELRSHGQTSTDLFVEGRNAVRLDVANFFNLPSSLLEGSMATATLTYSTAEGRRSEFLDYNLSYWAQPIEARLSMDDVTPPGTRIAFDISYMTQDQPTQFPATTD